MWHIPPGTRYLQTVSMLPVGFNPFHCSFPHSSLTHFLLFLRSFIVYLSEMKFNCSGYIQVSPPALFFSCSCKDIEVHPSFCHKVVFAWWVSSVLPCTSGNASHGKRVGGQLISSSLVINTQMKRGHTKLSSQSAVSLTMEGLGLQPQHSLLI